MAKKYKEIWNFTVQSTDGNNITRTSNITSDVITERTYEERRYLSSDLVNSFTEGEGINPDNAVILFMAMLYSEEVIDG